MRCKTVLFTCSKGSVWDEESADGQTDDGQYFEEPESVLYRGARIFRRFDIDHDDWHEEEEWGQSEADTIDGQIAHDGVAQLFVDDRVSEHGGVTQSRNLQME